MNLTQEDLCGNPATTWFWEDSTINYRNYCRLPSSVLASRDFLPAHMERCQVVVHYGKSKMLSLESFYLIRRHELLIKLRVPGCISSSHCIITTVLINDISLKGDLYNFLYFHSNCL